MGVIRGIIGLLFIAAIAFLFSNERKKIRHKNILVMIVVQLAITFLFLQTTIGLTMLSGVSDFFGWLTNQGMAGVDFVFGGLAFEPGGFVFFLNVLMPLVFISALIGILSYLKVLDFVVKWIGWGIDKITGMGELESYVPIATTLIGSPQIFITIKEQIPKLSKNQLFTVCLTVMSSAGAAMLASYMTMIDGKFVVVAVFLNFFSGLVIAGIMEPYEEKAVVIDNSNNTDELAEKESFFQMLGNYIISGFNLAIIVAAMVIGFISVISFLNNGLTAIIGISFTEIFGYLFAPVAYLIGVPSEDIIKVGSIMATKLLTNEFVAMGEVTKIVSELSTKSVAMISVYLVSFANFGTLGIISGAVKSIDEAKSVEIAKFSLKLILGGTLAGMLTAAIVGFYF